MIEKGLKVGSVFADGAFYKVDKVLDDGNYESHMISGEEYQRLVAPVVEPVVETVEKKPVKRGRK